MMIPVDAEPAVTHAYISTACLHGICGPACRQTCKYCGAPCQCQRTGCSHGNPDAPPSWADQARDMARELLGLVGTPDMPPDLLTRIVEDPALFWLREHRTARHD